MVQLEEIPVIYDLDQEWPTEWNFIRECLDAGTAKLIGHYRPSENVVIMRYQLIETEVME